MMIYSNYNVIKSLEGSTFIYNTLTSAFLKISTEQWESLSDDSDKDFINMLLKQGILVESHQTEVNKYKFFCYKKAFDEKVLKLTIAPTMLCNFACPYCFEGDHKSFSKMDADVENAIVKYIVKKSARQQINICWFGGEPLLAFDKIVSISSQLDENNVEYQANIITNGSLISDKVVDKMQSLHLTHIQISLDGLEDEHNKTRCYKNGKPSFGDIEKGIELLLSKTKIRVSLRVGVDNSRPKSYLEVYKYMENRFPEAIANKQLQVSANIIQNRTGFDGKGICFSNKQLYEKELFDLENKDEEYFCPSLPGLNMPCMLKTPSFLAIDSRGFIYPCLEFMGNPAKSIGNIVKGELSFSKRANLLFNNSAFDDEDCISCKVFPICGGGCPMDREKFKSHKEAYCTYYKNYLEELLPHFAK